MHGPDVELLTTLSVEESHSRLEAEGVSVWDVKSLFSRRETGQVAFLWYKRRGVLSTLLQGPALMGNLAACQQGCRVRVAYRPYVSLGSFLLIATVAAGIVFVLYVIPGQLSPTMFGVYVAVLAAAATVRSVILLLMRPHWEDLVRRLRRTLSAIEQK